MNIEFKTDFFKRLEKVNKPAFMRRLVNRAGVVAVNFSKERFVNKDWLGDSREKWKPRKRQARGSILVKSGRLKRSIRKLSEGDYFVYVGTDAPYAKIHNEGGTIDKTVNVRSHVRRKSATRTRDTRGKFKKRGQATRVNVKMHRRKMNLKIPRRQFLGDSAALGKRLERFAVRELDAEIQKP